VDPDVHVLDNVYVYNIDDLQGLVEENIRHRQREIEDAKALVQKIAEEFSVWYESLKVGQEKSLKHAHDRALLPQR